MHKIITHVIYGSLPKKGSTQVSTICSSPTGIKDDRYYYGYSGDISLSRKDLNGEGSTKFHQLEKPIDIVQENRLWINSKKEVLYGQTAKTSEKIGTIG